LVSNEGDVRVLAGRIKEIEHETDVITHQCVEALHKTFITRSSATTSTGSSAAWTT